MSRLMFAGGEKFKNVFADVFGYFNEDGRNKELENKENDDDLCDDMPIELKLCYHATFGSICWSALLWAPLVVVFVTISSAREQYEQAVSLIDISNSTELEDQLDNLHAIANYGLCGTFFVTCIIIVQLLSLYYKDPTAKEFGLSCSSSLFKLHFL